MSSDFAVEANEMLQSAVKALDHRRKMQRYKLHEVNRNSNRSDAVSKYHELENNKSYNNEVNVASNALDTRSKYNNNNDHNVEESNTYDTILRKINTLSRNLEEMQNKMGKLDTAAKLTFANAQQQQQQQQQQHSSVSSWEKMKEYCRVEIVQLERELLMMSSDWKDRFEYAHSQNKQAQAILQKQLDDVAMKTKINVKEQLESKEWTERKLRNITTQLDNQKREITEVQMTLAQQEQRASDALQHQIKDVLLQLHTVEHNQQRELSTVQREMSQKIIELSSSIKKISEQYVEEYLKAHNKRENVISDENDFSNSNVSIANNNKRDAFYSNEVRALHRQMQLLKEVTANNVHEVQEAMETSKLEQMKTNKVIQECKVKVMAHDERVEGLEELIHSEVNRMNVLQRKHDSHSEQVEVCNERIAQMSKDVHHVTSTLGQVQTTVEQNTKQIHQTDEHVETLQSRYDTLLQRMNNMQNDYNTKTAQQENFMNKDDVISEIDKRIRQVLRNDKEKTLVELEERISHSCNAIREDCGRQLNKCTQTYNTLLQEQIEDVTNNINNEINKLKKNELAIWHQQLDETSLECLNHHKVMESKLVQLEHKLTGELENVNNSHKNKQSTFETRMECKLNEWRESIRVEQAELEAEQTKMKSTLDKCMSSIKDQRDSTINNSDETVTKEVVQEITKNIVNNKFSALQSKFDLSLQSLQNNQDYKLEHHSNQVQISINDITRKLRELQEYKTDIQSKIEQSELEISNIKEELVLHTKDKLNVTNNNNNDDVTTTTSSVEMTNMNNKISSLEKCLSEISNRLSEFVAQTNAQHTQSCQKIEHMEQSLKSMQQHISEVQNKIETSSEPLQTKKLMQELKNNLIIELQNYIDGKIDAINDREINKLSPAPSQKAQSNAGVAHPSSSISEEYQEKYPSTTKEQNTRYKTGTDKTANVEEQNKEYKTLQLLRDSVEMLSNELESSHHSSSTSSFNKNDHDVDEQWSENNAKYDLPGAAAKEESVPNKRVTNDESDNNYNSSSISEVSTIDVNGGGADKLTSVSSSVPVMLFANKTTHNYEKNTHYVNVKNEFNSNQESEEEEEEEYLISKDNDSASNAEYQAHKINEMTLNSINKSKTYENETEEELNNTNRSSLHVLEHSTITHSDDNTHTHRPRSLIISPPKSDSSSSHHSSHVESYAAEENRKVDTTIHEQEKEQQQQHDSFDESSHDDQENEETHKESELEEEQEEEEEEQLEEESGGEEEEKQNEEKEQQLDDIKEPVVKNNYDDWDDDDDDDDEEENNDDEDVNKKQYTMTGNGNVNIELSEEKLEINQQVLSKPEQKLNTEEHTEEQHKLEENSSLSSSSLELPLGDEGKQEQCKDNATENAMTSTHVDDNLHTESQVELPAATTVSVAPTIKTEIKKYTDFDDSSTESENEE